MDNALENFYFLLDTFDYNSEIDLSLNNNFLKLNCDKEVFKKVLIEIFKNYKQFVCIKEKEDSGELKEFKKDFILIQHRRSGESVYLNSVLFTNPDEEVPKFVDAFEKGSNNCVLCGSSFKKSSLRQLKKYYNLTQASYPFTTKIKSLNGVRSYKNGEYFSFKEYNSVCLLCYLIGQLGWLTDKFIYRSFVSTKKSYLLLPNSNDLKELHDFKSDYANLLNNNERWSNIKVSLIDEKGEATNGKFSTLLCFFSRFYLISDEIPSSISWNIIEIPLGKVKNIKSLEFNSSDTILNIIKSFIDEEEDIYTLFSSLYFFNDFEMSNKFRENISESFLKDDFRSFARNFIPRSGKKISFSNKNIEFLEYFNYLIKLWRVNSMSISEEDLKSIRSVGNIIAKVSVTNSSLFYKLDKIRSLDDFWGCLREISRKLVNSDIDKSKIREMSLDELVVLLKRNEDNWKEIRDLLIVYAAIYYSVASRGGENDGDKRN